LGGKYQHTLDPVRVPVHECSSPEERQEHCVRRIVKRVSLTAVIHPYAVDDAEICTRSALVAPNQKEDKN